MTGAILGNLDSSEGKYNDKTINKIENGEKELENLMKSQISVTISFIKKFNYTIRKLQIDEQTLNENTHIIENAILHISNK